MTPKQVDGIAYLLMFVLFGIAFGFFFQRFDNPKPKIIEVSDDCQLIEYKNNYFLNCK